MNWDQWMDLHGSLFGFGLGKSAPQEMAMLASWTGVFESERYNPAEVADASRAMASRVPHPEYRSQHLAELLGILRTARARLLESIAAQDRLGGGDMGLPYCPDCEGTGICSVPYANDTPQQRKAIEAGTLATFAVACSCSVGVARRPTRRDGVALMSLAQYETQMPRWRQVVAASRVAARKLGSAVKETSDVDRVLGRILGRRGAV